MSWTVHLARLYRFVLPANCTSDSDAVEDVRSIVLVFFVIDLSYAPLSALFAAFIMALDLSTGKLL
jgi:hypothetical protein